MPKTPEIKKIQTYAESNDTKKITHEIPPLDPHAFIME
jgi:hypothetical protein